ncbi:MAG TPA: hypothetical protein VGE47_08395, partial [Burkholderiaceae bacterium]
LDEPAREIRLLNRAVLWQLQWAMQVSDRMGYSRVATHLSEAIDALLYSTKLLDEEALKKVERDERIQMLEETFERYGHFGGSASDLSKAGDQRANNT